MYSSSIDTFNTTAKERGREGRRGGGMEGKDRERDGDRQGKFYLSTILLLFVYFVRWDGWQGVCYRPMLCSTFIYYLKERQKARKWVKGESVSDGY